jgi:hypothetical protein
MHSGERRRRQSVVANETGVDGGGGDQRRKTAYRAATRRPHGRDFRVFGMKAK